MKTNVIQHTILLLAFLIAQYAGHAQILTQANTQGNWQAYGPAGTPPPGWMTSTATANWGPVIQAQGDSALQNQINWLTNNFFTGATNTNYVWSGPFNTPTTIFLRYIFHRDSVGSDSLILRYAADDNALIQVNGQQVLGVYQVSASTLQDGWQRVFEADINSLLNCDTNIITVSVTNNRHWGFFIARLQSFGPPVRSLCFPAPALDVTVSDINCEQNLQFTLNATPISGATYQWRAPNNTMLNANQASVTINPLSSPNPGLLQGWYVCTATYFGCCTVTDSVEVRFPVCCQLDLQAEQMSCKDYVLSIQDPLVNLQGFFWVVDGVVLSDTNKSKLFRLEEGTHEICVRYLAQSKTHPNELCCDEVCVTLSVPVAERDTQTRSYCDFDTYTGLEPSNEFDTQQYDYYILRQITSPFHFYDSRTAGQTWHAISQGTWTVDYYDNAECLKKQLVVHVVTTPSDTTNCFSTYTNSCSGQRDPQQIMPFWEISGGCAECSAISQTDPQAPYQHISSKLDANLNHIGEVYQKTFYDYTNCRVCVFTYEILFSRCEINVDFDIVPTGIPFRFTFVNQSSGNGFLIGHTWQVAGYFNQTFLPGEPETTQMDFTFNGPGVYNICLNLFNFHCGIKCPGQKCISVIINEQGEIVYDDQHLPIRSSLADSEESSQGEPMVSPESDQILVVPNPTSSVFRLQQSGKQGSIFEQVTICDNTGKELLSKRSVSSAYEYNIAEFGKGIYIVRVKFAGKDQQLKLILQ